MASWRSGDSADCKSVYTGSIPVLASKSQAIDLAHITDRDIQTHGLSTDFRGTPMRIDQALKAYKSDHCDTLKTGAEALQAALHRT